MFDPVQDSSTLIANYSILVALPATLLFLKLFSKLMK